MLEDKKRDCNSLQKKKKLPNLKVFFSDLYLFGVSNSKPKAASRHESRKSVSREIHSQSPVSGLEWIVSKTQNEARKRMAKNSDYKWRRRRLMKSRKEENRSIEQFVVHRFPVASVVFSRVSLEAPASSSSRHTEILPFTTQNVWHTVENAKKRQEKKVLRDTRVDRITRNEGRYTVVVLSLKPRDGDSASPAHLSSSCLFQVFEYLSQIPFSDTSLR